MPMRVASQDLQGYAERQAVDIAHPTSRSTPKEMVFAFYLGAAKHLKDSQGDELMDRATLWRRAA
eukprot:471161-Pyramimonas_sp.AAC.1